MNPLKKLCDILQLEMGLADNQVYLYNQKINTPNDEQIYIAVGLLSCKPFSNTTETVNGVDTQSTNFQATVSIDITSRGPDARDRKEEVIMALKSTYSQQVQEANGFYIAPLSSSFANLSGLEGAAIPYRFSISVNIQYQVTKTQAVAFYDTFNRTLIVED